MAARLRERRLASRKDWVTTLNQEKQAADMYHTTGFTKAEISELCVRIEARKLARKYSEVLLMGTPKTGVAIAGGHVGGGVTGPGFCRSAVAGPRCGGPRGWRSRAGTGRVPRRTGAFRRGGRIRRGRRSGR